MKIDAPRWIFPMLALLGLLWLPLYGCNTMEGAGEDIEQGGEAIQDAADGPRMGQAVHLCKATLLGKQRCLVIDDAMPLTHDFRFLHGVHDVKALGRVPLAIAAHRPINARQDSIARLMVNALLGALRFAWTVATEPALNHDSKRDRVATAASSLADHVAGKPL